MLVIVIAAVIGENALLKGGQVTVTVGVVVAAVAAVVGCLLRQTAAIRGDIREGRALSR